MRYLKYEMGSGYKNTQNSEVGHLFLQIFPSCLLFSLLCPVSPSLKNSKKFTCSENSENEYTPASPMCTQKNYIFMTIDTHR